MGFTTCGEQQLQQQVEERLEQTKGWKWEQVQPEPKRDLRWRPGGEGRLHGRRRKSPRLPGTFGKMDRCRPRHLGGGCASDVPGVYARMSHSTQWIDQN